MRLNISVTGILALLILPQAARGVVTNGEQLAERFRPYYKFSIEDGSEPCRPCSWQWFVAHSELFYGDTRLASSAELATNYNKLLTYPDADVRTASKRECILTLRPAESSWGGEPWENVISNGAGLYVQCEDAGNEFVVLTYWTLFAYNKTTVTGDHEGDIIAVAVVYDRKRDQLARASYGMHGKVLASFDLVPAKNEQIVELKGRDPDDKAVSVRAKRIQTARDYQNGPWWYTPSDPEVYLVEDPVSGRWEHLAIFCEWGSHEPWPNSTGNAMLTPKHNGDGVSFLPKRVRYLGSFEYPNSTEAPFVFFNGQWGNVPKGIIFHQSCFYPETRAHNHFKIPERSFVDRDFFDPGTLPWPPSR